MFRLWAKIFKENHLLKDVVICNDQEDTRTHKVFQALDEACYESGSHPPHLAGPQYQGL